MKGDACDIYMLHVLHVSSQWNRTTSHSTGTMHGAVVNKINSNLRINLLHLLYFSGICITHIPCVNNTPADQLFFLSICSSSVYIW